MRGQRLRHPGGGHPDGLPALAATDPETLYAGGMTPRRLRWLAAAVVAAVAAWHASPAHAQTATTAGAITTPYPTSQGVAIEWAISGDSNANGVVTVRYRPNGGAWKTGMPLVRVPAGANTTGTFGSGNGQWSNKHAGSLFDLEPEPALRHRADADRSRRRLDDGDDHGRDARHPGRVRERRHQAGDALDAVGGAVGRDAHRHPAARRRAAIPRSRSPAAARPGSRS